MNNLTKDEELELSIQRIHQAEKKKKKRMISFILVPILLFLIYQAFQFMSELYEPFGIQVKNGYVTGHIINLQGNYDSARITLIPLNKNGKDMRDEKGELLSVQTTVTPMDRGIHSFKIKESFGAKKYRYHDSMRMTME